MKKWALLSVFDKTGVVEFAKTLESAGYGILSTGGTASTLQAAGVTVTPVEDYTGFPEMMGGRVKTLHPKIHGGLLGVRDNADHVRSMEEHAIDAIDVVVVNLYPFEQTIAKPDVTFEEAVEMIDIGGPSMLRSAAKNHQSVIPVVDPLDYTWIAERLAEGNPLTQAERKRLAAKVYATTSAYDAAISAYVASQADVDAEAGAVNANHVSDATGVGATSGGVGSEAETTWPETFNLSFVHKQSLRYGENPHQSAHFYVDRVLPTGSIAAANQLQGKELSYNNIQDADAALRILRELDDLRRPGVVAVKHMNPCGVGIGEDIGHAFARAYEADPVSIFGGIIACNREVDGDLADKLTSMFLEIVIAPSFSADALSKFAKKKNVRLLTTDVNGPLWNPGDRVFRRVSGGLLVQEVDGPAAITDWQVVTHRAPTEEEKLALTFGWKIVKHVKSNAIVLATDSSTVGVGAGQMNRVGAAEIAIKQAGARAVGSILASDAFFPMRDTVDTAAAAGVKAIIQPGGSIKDQESIDAANEHGIAMVFTGRRHFLH